MALNFIDISNWQAGLNLSAVPHDAVIVKATEGVGFTDSTCDGFMAQAQGGLRGVYHFARPEYGNSAVAEAEFFVDQTRGYYDGSTIPVLDWEPGGGQAGNVTWAKTWLDRVTELLGVNPVIYMNASTEASHDWSSIAEHHGLWIASYPDYQEQGYSNRWPVTPKHWTAAFAQQYTSSGKLPGCNGHLDLNEAYVDAAGWRAYAGGGNIAAVPHAEPATPRPEAPQASWDTYLVQGGDTLSGIAASFGADWQTLAAVNGIANPDLIYPGQTIHLPAGANWAAPTPTAPTLTTVIVELGDTLWGIADAYGTTVEALVGANAITNPDLIYPGQELVIA